MEIVFICDRQKCEVCHDECRHTKDINHAVNFAKVTDDKYMEINDDLAETLTAILRARAEG